MCDDTPSVRRTTDDLCELLLVSTEDASSAISMGSRAISAIAESNARARAIGAWVSEHADELSGTDNAWHNLVLDVSSHVGDYRTALLLAKTGISRYPRDATLVADALMCASQLGDWEEGDPLLELACEPGYLAGEDWRVYVFAAEYLKAKALSLPLEEREAAYDRAVRFLDSAPETLLGDRVINQKAEVLLQAGRTDDARDVLERAIFVTDYRGDGIRNASRMPVPQCCVTYLDVLRESCDYEKIIQVSDAGIRFSNTVQETANMGYFVYRKALAMDGQINSPSGPGHSQGYGNQDYVRQTLRTFALAYALNTSSETRRICRQRFAYLAANGDVLDLHVDDFEPMVSGEKNDD